MRQLISQTIMAETGRKNYSLSLAMKVKLLELVDKGDKLKSEICKEYRIPNSTLSTIIKNRERITSAFEQRQFEPGRKRLRKSKYDDLDKALFAWFKEACAQHTPISGPVLMAKADELSNELGIDFKANVGWLDRFKTRNGILLKNNCDEASRFSSDITDDWMTKTHMAMLNDYPYKGIFNADDGVDAVNEVQGSTHNEEKQYKCDVCNKTYPWSSSLRLHKRTHTGEKPYKCDLCHKAFSLRFRLRDHQKTHTREKPHKCSLRRKAFAQKVQLQNLTRSHSGESQCKCKTCHQEFSQQSSLKVHMRKHSGEDPHRSVSRVEPFTQTVKRKSLKQNMKPHSSKKHLSADLPTFNADKGHSITQGCGVCDEMFEMEKEKEFMFHCYYHYCENPRKDTIRELFELRLLNYFP